MEFAIVHSAYKERNNAIKAFNFSSIFWSILIHVLILYLLLRITTSINKNTPQQTIPIISAQLLYKNKKVVPDVKSSKTTVIQTANQISKNAELKNSKNMEVLSEKSQVKEPLVVKKKVDALSSLKSLRENINSKIYHQNAKQAYKEYIANKNFIPRSTTKFNKLPEAKAVNIEVNCNSAVNKSLSVLSGLLGGSIKCTSFNGSQKFIDARLEKLGKKKDKK